MWVGRVVARGRALCKYDHALQPGREPAQRARPRRGARCIRARRRRGQQDGAHGRSNAAASTRRPLAVPKLGTPRLLRGAWRLWAVRFSQGAAGPLGAQPLPWLLELAACHAGGPTHRPCYPDRAGESPERRRPCEDDRLRRAGRHPHGARRHRRRRRRQAPPVARARPRH